MIIFIEGIFKQKGQALQLTLPKIEKVIVIEKQQTPVPLFPYESEDVEYDSKDGKVHLGGTLTYPLHSGKFPTIILISGSGLQDRDGTIGSHKPFFVIADYFTRRGFAVLRVDDRVIGKSKSSAKEATTEDFANDVLTSLAYLRARKEVDVTKIGLMGHSEGGLIAQELAANKKAIAFIILLASSGIKTIEMMEEQNRAFLQKAGMNARTINYYIKLYRKLALDVAKAKDTLEAKKIALQIFNSFKKSTPNDVFALLFPLGAESDQQKVIDSYVLSFSSPWWKNFISVDPAFYQRKIKIPVLALNGNEDIQVLAASNLRGIQNGLRQAGNKHFKIQKLTGLNHLFQSCKLCTVNEYTQLEETFSVAALQAMEEWLKVIIK